MNKYEIDVFDENEIRKSLNDDVLLRKKDMINLSKIFNCLNGNYIISIDGAWGTGKTFFINQLLYCFNNDVTSLFSNNDANIISKLKEVYIPVYYNAWANDDHSDIVESLIFNILNEYPKYRKNILFDKDDFRNLIEDFGKNFIEKSSKGFFTKEMFNNFKSIKDFADNVITYEEKKQCLEKLLNKIIGDNNRLLLIIDELDRCKPDYAVKTLETIKHFYNIDKITIVVSTDNVQLSNCIKHFYGDDFDGYGYLNKIYDTVLTLTLKNRDRYLETYCNFFNSEASEQISYILIDHYDMSLRECNRLVSMYDLSCKYISMSDGFAASKFSLCSSFFLMIGLVLKIKDIREFNNYVRGNDDDFVIKIMKKVINKKPHFSNWFKKQLSGNKDVPNDWNIEDELLNMYHETFNKTKDPMAFPMIEALSLIGSKIIVDGE